MRLYVVLIVCKFQPHGSDAFQFCSTCLFINIFWKSFSMFWNMGSQKSVHPLFKSCLGKWWFWVSRSLLPMSLRNVWILELFKNVIALLEKSFRLVKRFRFVLVAKLVHCSFTWTNYYTFEAYFIYSVSLRLQHLCLFFTALRECTSVAGFIRAWCDARNVTEAGSLSLLGWCFPGNDWSEICRIH